MKWQLSHSIYRTHRVSRHFEARRNSVSYLNSQHESKWQEPNLHLPTPRGSCPGGESKELAGCKSLPRSNHEEYLEDTALPSHTWLVLITATPKPQYGDCKGPQPSAGEETGTEKGFMTFLPSHGSVHPHHVTTIPYQHRTDPLWILPAPVQGCSVQW